MTTMLTLIIFGALMLLAYKYDWPGVVLGLVALSVIGGLL